jgi:phenylalanyl-tRNA synthetase beta chain
MNLLISYNWIKEYVDTKLSVKDFAQKLSLKGPSIEKWYLFKDDDYVLDVEITTNRSDMASVIGLAREASVILNTQLKEPKLEKVIYNNKEKIKVEILNKEICRRYQSIVIKNVKIKESPKWLKDRLEASGLKSVNNVVDITNYVLLEYGQPTHVFDYDKIADKKIIIRNANDGEKFTSLDNKEYKLKQNDLVIADNNGVIGLAGIKGGNKAEVDYNTKNIVFESANFDPVAIRKTSRRINLKTEASKLFERNLNPNLTNAVIIRLIGLALRHAEGEVASEIVDEGNKKKLKLNKINFNPRIVNDILGIEIEKKEILGILTKLGFKCEEVGESQLVTVPYFRTEDVMEDYDLVEEIARIYGYDQIPSELPKGEIPIYKTDPRINFEDNIKDYLANQGYIEAFSYSMISKRQLDLVNINSNETIKLINPLNDNFEYMRKELTSSLLEVVEGNEMYKEKLKIFELNKVYLEQDNKSLPIEQSNLAIAVNGGSEKEAFYELKGIWEYIAKKLNLNNNRLQYLESKFPQYSSECNGEILYKNERIGLIGIINEKIKKDLSLKKHLAILEVNIDKLFEAYKEIVVSYTPIPKYPAVNRDFAFFVDVNQKWQEIEEEIKNIIGELFVSCKLFDVYKGKNIGKNKKSITFNLVMQSKEKTLEDKEIDKKSKDIINSLNKKFNAKIRD